jgi:hypothetical protein
MMTLVDCHLTTTHEQESMDAFVCEPGGDNWK